MEKEEWVGIAEEDTVDKRQLSSVSVYYRGVGKRQWKLCSNDLSFYEK